MVFVWTLKDILGLTVLAICVAGIATLFAIAWVMDRLRQLKTWWRGKR